MDASRLHHAVSTWRRLPRASAAAMTNGLLAAMAGEGFVVGDKDDPSALVSMLEGLGYRVTPPPEKSAADGRALLLRRATELENSAALEDRIEGLRLRLQAIGG